MLRLSFGLPACSHQPLLNLRRELLPQRMQRSVDLAFLPGTCRLPSMLGSPDPLRIAWLLDARPFLSAGSAVLQLAGSYAVCEDPRTALAHSVCSGHVAPLLFQVCLIAHCKKLV